MGSPSRPAAGRGRLRFLPVVVVGCALAVAVGACGDSGSSAPTVITGAAAKRGEALAADNGCKNCHTVSGRRSTGPTWRDLAGSEVKLDDGSVVTADAAYLATAITDPRSQVVAGYPNIMPSSYDFTAAQVADLVAYLQELSPG